MKKNLFAIMVLAALVTTFAGCSNKKTKQTETAGQNTVQQVQNQRLLIIVDPQIDFLLPQPANVVTRAASTMIAKRFFFIFCQLLFFLIHLHSFSLQI